MSKCENCRKIEVEMNAGITVLRQRIDILKGARDTYFEECKQLKSQLAACRWIPANEPPKEDGIYFVRRQDNTIPTARVFNDGMWHSHDTVLYWMHILPLPAPAKPTDRKWNGGEGYGLKDMPKEIE